MRKLAALLAFVLVLPSVAEAQPIARWVQIMPGGMAETRAIVQGTTCPDATVDGATAAMQVRAAPLPLHALRPPSPASTT